MSKFLHIFLNHKSIHNFFYDDLPELSCCIIMFEPYQKKENTCNETTKGRTHKIFLQSLRFACSESHFVHDDGNQSMTSNRHFDKLMSKWWAIKKCRWAFYGSMKACNDFKCRTKNVYIKPLSTDKKYFWNFSFFHSFLPGTGPHTRGIISSIAEHDGSSKQSCRARIQFSIAIAIFTFGPVD